MVDVPADTPVTTPVVALMLATPVLLLLHTPPDELLLNVVVLPTQTLDMPEIGPNTGLAYTVTTCVAVPTQPLPSTTV